MAFLKILKKPAKVLAMIPKTIRMKNGAMIISASPSSWPMFPETVMAIAPRNRMRNNFLIIFSFFTSATSSAKFGQRSNFNYEPSGRTHSIDEAV